MDPDVCRVCLSSDLKIIMMSAPLLEMYEKITDVKLIPGGNNTLCYICHSMLQKCSKFSIMACQSEKYLEVLERAVEDNTDAIINYLNIGKPQTLSVIKQKTIVLNGSCRKSKPKKFSNTQSEESTFNNDILLETHNAKELITYKTIRKKSTETKELVKNVITIEGTIRPEVINTEVNDLTTDKKTKTNIELNDTESNEELFIIELTNKNVPVENESATKIETFQDVFQNDTATKVLSKMDANDAAENEDSINYEIETKETNSDELIYFETDEEDVKEVKDYVVINDTELYYECDICNNIFKTRDELTAHQNTHKIEPKPTYKLEDIKKKTPNTRSPYCPICKKFLAGYESQLQEHLRIHTGERPFICDHCGKSSRTKQHLKEHIRTHTKEKVYCKICDKGFTQASSLGKHAIIHSGLFPFCCHICGKSFKQNGQMKAHIRFIHEGVRPYGCDICGKRYPAKSEWRRHMDAHIGKKSYSCENCDRKFATNSAVIRHKKHNCRKGGPIVKRVDKRCGQKGQKMQK